MFDTNTFLFGQRAGAKQQPVCRRCGVTLKSGSSERLCKSCRRKPSPAHDIMDATITLAGAGILLGGTMAIMDQLT